MDNFDKETYTYNGKTYTTYDVTQKQRNFERAIRESKLKILGYRNLGDNDASLYESVRLRRLQDENKVFSQATGSRARFERTGVVGYNRGVSGRVVADKYEGTHNHHINYAKAIDEMFQNGDKVIYEKENIIEEMNTSLIGQKILEYLERSQAEVILMNRRPLHPNRGSQNGNQITIYCGNIRNERVVTQTLIHEMTHYWYHIGGCQHAEAVCFAMEKMHLLKRDYLTEDEWEQMVKLAVDNYPELEWECGGYGDFKQFNFVKEEPKGRE